MIWGLFGAMVFGSVAGVFYPLMIAAFKTITPKFEGGLENSRWKWLIGVGAGIGIGVLLAAITFATFLGTPENQKNLLSLGLAAYFLSFTAGFTAASAAEELARK